MEGDYKMENPGSETNRVKLFMPPPLIRAKSLSGPQALQILHVFLLHHRVFGLYHVKCIASHHVL